MRQISEAMFIACTGRKPVEDDMERVNCPKQGEVGHWSCGWNWSKSLPVFQVGSDQPNAPFPEIP